MMRGLALLALAALALTSASDATVATALSPDRELQKAEAEAEAAARRAAALQGAVARASGETATLRARQQAAAADIEAAEARLAAADAALRSARAELARREADLARKRAPTAALLAGLASMGRQPPLLALADGASIEEMVRVRALLDTTMPVIRQRSAALAADVERNRQLAAAAAEARRRQAQGREQLVRQRQVFARLEQESAARTASLAGAAFGEEDRVLASGESVADLKGEAAAAAAARANARQLAALGLSPPRPSPADGATAAPPLAYTLPANAPVTAGLGSVDSSGVVARGLTMTTGRGTPLVAPADGRILFVGAYRDRDGIMIIDHGGGWTSLILNVASTRPKGSRLQRGEPIGTALGPIGVELRQRGRPVSAALIAGSSAPLSNGAETR